MTGLPLLGTALVVLSLACGLATAGCSRSGTCGETVTESVTNPSENTTAKVIVVNCGAMTRYFPYVSINTSRVKLRDDGLLFGYSGNPKIAVSWTDERSLLVQCPSCEESKVYRRVSKEEQFRITYGALFQHGAIAAKSE